MTTETSSVRRGILDARAAMRKFIAERQMVLMTTYQCGGKPNPPAELQQYRWPAASNTTEYDRIVWVFVYSDGQWSVALDDGQLDIEAGGVALIAMASASPPLA